MDENGNQLEARLWDAANERERTRGSRRRSTPRLCSGSCASGARIRDSRRQEKRLKARQAGGGRLAGGLPGAGRAPSAP